MCGGHITRREQPETENQGMTKIAGYNYPNLKKVEFIFALELYKSQFI